MYWTRCNPDHFVGPASYTFPSGESVDDPDPSTHRQSYTSILQKVAIAVVEHQRVSDVYSNYKIRCFSDPTGSPKIRSYNWRSNATLPVIASPFRDRFVDKIETYSHVDCNNRIRAERHGPTVP